MLYCAIIGDIVKSKKLKVLREEVQNKFKKVISEINENRNYQPFIESKFTVTLGDEFQGLLNNPGMSYEIIQEIKEKMKPTEMVFGVGVGTMETSINKEIAIGSDGPAYHYARKMCERAKKKRPSICYCTNTLIDELVNSQIYLIEAITKKRTDVQRQVIMLYKEGYSQEDICKMLNKKNQSTISRHLKAAHYSEVQQAEEQIKGILRKIMSTSNL